MRKKNTRELENILEGAHTKDFAIFYENNRESMMTEQESFPVYMKNIFREKKMTQQMIFLKADIPERYGYKILSGEKHTKQRDTILRICYAAELTLEETQEALKKYEMPQLYAKMPRDALLMIIFNERPGSIIDVNELLKRNGLEPLRTSGFSE